MSKYTTEVRFICENYAGLNESEGYNSISDIIANSRQKVFDFSYPIFDENYRSVLETKILKHFYLREICAETVGVWKHFLDVKMNEIMPYYNKLYSSELIEFNPLYDVDLTTDYNKDAKGTGTIGNEFEENSTLNRTINDDEDISRSKSETINSEKETSDTTTSANKNDHWDMYSDTPQGGLTGVRSEEYLTNARHITDDTTGSTQTTTGTAEEERTLTGSETVGRENETTEATTGRKTGENEQTRNLRDIEDYIQHVKGKSAGSSYSKLLQEFRDTFLNIDVMIIKDLNDLFFGLW